MLGLTHERYQALRAAARRVDKRFELLVAFGVETGLRYDEAARLRGEDLVLDADQPYVHLSRHGRRNRKDQERAVPIRRSFARRLRALELDAGPIFGARVRRGEAFKEWRLATFARVPFWTWHLLRHTFASWHVQAGVSIAKVAVWMGDRGADRGADREVRS